ncbi:hypothetical protein I317_03324 [Kwoniella heveanensis CBS 569]|nr:hypothetical protein I317_03324 [Kwoniella heveanensis CBS 569]
MTSLKPAPLSSLVVSKYHIPAYQNFPNTSLRPYPLLIYKQAFDPSSSASSFSPSAIESYLRNVGAVEPAWRYTMYQQHHYHSNTNEVLLVSSGRAKLCFGGSADNDNRVEIDADKGDVIIIPAGVGHALLHEEQKAEGGGERYQMIGSYPTGSENWDMCTGEKGEKDGKWRAIEQVGWFERDPIYGDEGPIVELAKEMKE